MSSGEHYSSWASLFGSDSLQGLRKVSLFEWWDDLGRTSSNGSRVPKKKRLTSYQCRQAKETACRNLRKVVCTRRDYPLVVTTLSLPRASVWGELLSIHV